MPGGRLARAAAPARAHPQNALGDLLSQVAIRVQLYDKCGIGNRGGGAPPTCELPTQFNHEPVKVASMLVAAAVVVGRTALIAALSSRISSAAASTDAPPQNTASIALLEGHASRHQNKAAEETRLGPAIADDAADAASGRLPCSSAADCALNGECVGGTCHCDPPWKNFNATFGACTLLDMLPVPTTACGPGCAYHGNTSVAGRPIENSSSWGARVIPNKSGGYIMAVAEGAFGCDFLATWRSNSQTAIAVADTPLGPFKKLGVAVAPWSTNPALLKALVGS